MPDPGDTDFLLFWSSTNEEYFNLLDKYKEPKGLCLTTDPTNPDNLRKVDIVFVESDPIYGAVRALGMPVIKAFGTDTDFFKPDTTTKKDIEYFYPATFSPWKRQSDIAYLGSKLLCVGTVQPDGQEEIEACRRNGVLIEEGYFPVTHILKYYQGSKNVIIPAVHGSERTVLEAMSCDILPTVIHPTINKRANSYLQEFERSELKSPREFVLKNYNHKQFAKNLLKGIKQCLK